MAQSGEDIEGPGGVAPDGEASASAGPPRRRLGPGFAWGLAGGALIAILIFVIGIVVLYVMWTSQYTRFARSPGRSQATVVISPVKAGQDWFSVGPDGNGTLQGWSAGSSGSGDSEPAGAVAYFDVGNVGSVAGVKVTHTVRMNVDKDTQFVIGNQPYDKGKSRSAADALFNSDSGPASDVLTERLLTIDFHRVGDSLVADRVTAPLETGQRSPLDN
jgi:hypothetical protein